MKNKIGGNLLSFALMISLLGLTICMILFNTIFSKNYLLKVLDKNNYYEETYQNVKENFENNLVQSGIDDYITEELVTQEKVTEDINSIINNLYQNKYTTIDTSTIRKNLDDKINSILEENNRVPSSEEKEDINVLEDHIESAYLDEISYSIDTINSLTKPFYQIGTMLKIAIGILTILSIILTILLLLFVKGSLSYIGTSLLASGFVLIITRILVASRHKSILILNQSFSNILINVLSDILKNILFMGILSSIIGLFILILGICNEKLHKK